ncbi:hypothetical protein ANANG_G00110310 [Anguilla anguilla]|uniref:Uncharacterized protein n=1 Tax=Anguilla anguilla TaxID=7936 RepID=A0A9D3MLD6_ANGAN|nr:hypothetical protein ANANG_G00110310 [Anguilla anguilla]
MQTQMKVTEEAQPITEQQTQMATQGSLVTELENADQIETIQVDEYCQLCINDLPDLEEVDPEDPHGMDFFTSQDVFRPKIEVISGTSDESESDEAEDPPAERPLVRESRRPQTQTRPGPGPGTRRAVLQSRRQAPVNQTRQSGAHQSKHRRGTKARQKAGEAKMSDRRTGLNATASVTSYLCSD